MAKNTEEEFDLPQIWEDIQQSRSDKTSESRLWDLVRAYLEDKQNGLAMDTRTNTLVASTVAAPYGGTRGRLQFNIMKSAYRTLTSMLTVNVPGIRSRPASPSIEDIVKAQSNELAAQYWWHEQHVPDVAKRKLIPWLITTGNAFMHVRYSSNQKKVIPEVVSPYDCYPEPNNIDPDEVAWWAIRKMMSKKDLIKLFPDYKQVIEDYGQESKREQRGQYTDDKTPRGSVDVYYVYWKDGKCGICLGEDWLYKSKTPTGYLTFFRFTYFAGKLWGHSPFVSMIDHQTAINRRKNMELDSADLMANPVWMVPVGSVVNPDAISNKPGKVIQFNHLTGAPQRVSGVSMPPDFASGTAQLQSEAYEMLGLNSVQLGKRVIGVTSGKGMEVLADKSTSQLQMTMSDLELGLTEVTSNALRLIKTFYSEGMLIRMLDDSGRVVYEQLQTQDFDEDPEVFLQSDTLFRTDLQDMEARTLDLYDRKMIPADEAMKRLTYSLGSYQANKKMRSWAHAQKLLVVATGAKGLDKGIEIFPTDDLEAILEVFNEFMQTDDFYNNTPPERQDYIAGIVAAVGANGKMTPDQLAEAANARIWPVQPKDDRATVQYLGSTGSPMAQAQIADQASMMSDKAEAMQSAMEGVASQAPQGTPAPAMAMPVQ